MQQTAAVTTCVSHSTSDGASPDEQRHSVVPVMKHELLKRGAASGGRLSGPASFEMCPQSGQDVATHDARSALSAPQPWPLAHRSSAPVSHFVSAQHAVTALRHLSAMHDPHGP